MGCSELYIYIYKNLQILYVSPLFVDLQWAVDKSIETFKILQ